MSLLLALMWSVVGKAPLAGEVHLRVDGTELELSLDSEMPPNETVFISSYLMALHTPYLAGDVDRLWDYPHGPDGSKAEWLEIRVDGVALPLPGPLALVALPPGKRVQVRMRAHIPERYGGLGETDGDIMLAAAVPFLLRGTPHSVSAHALRVHWRMHYATLSRGQWLLQSPEFNGDPSLFVNGIAKRGYLTLDGKARAPIVRPAAAKLRPDPGDAEAQTLADARWAFFGESADARLIKAHSWLRDALKEIGVPAQRWVLHALRRETAVCGEDVLIVSREMFRATPLFEIMSFQRFGLARRALACALRHAWSLSAEDADALASAQVDLLFRREQTTFLTPRDLLRPLSFIPDIDSLIYAPQMPWAEVYFMALDEPRVGPPLSEMFFHGRARGKLLYEKLWDRLGPDLTRAYVDSALARHTGLSTIAQERVPAVWAGIEGDFAGAHPVYDLSYEVVGNKLVIKRHGPGALSAEAVSVRVADSSGKQTLLRAEALTPIAEMHAEAKIEAPSSIAEVVLDPERRAVEYLLKAGEHPRFNNTSSHRARIVLSRLSAAYGSSASEVFAGVDFNVRREWDLHHHFGFGVDYDPLSAGISARYGYAFGPLVTADLLAYRLTVKLSGQHYAGGFVGEKSAVYSLEGFAQLAYDSRPSDRTAMSGFGWRVFTALGVPLSRTPFAYLGGGILKIQAIADGHAIAGRLRFGAVVGDAPAQALFTLGGRENARGFPQTEHTAKIRMTANIEYRHVLMRGFRASLFDLVYLDGVEGAVFGDAVLMSNDWRDLFAAKNAFVDVGYGIRFLYDQLGVNPGLIAIDVGIPLKRYDASRPPVSVYVDFVQSFSGL